MCYTRAREMNIGPDVFAYSVHSFDYSTIRGEPSARYSPGTGRFDAKGEAASFWKILGPSGGHRQVSNKLAVCCVGCGNGETAGGLGEHRKDLNQLRTGQQTSRRSCCLLWVLGDTGL